MKKILTIILSIVLLPSVALAQFTVSAGGTGHRSVSSGSILFGSTSLRLGTSSDLYWDYLNSHLGISTTSPWAKLSIGSQSASPFSFAVGSSTRPQFSITKDGNTIVGNTTTPSALVTLEATNGTDYPNDLLFSVVGSLPEYAYDEILEQDVQVATDTSKLFSISERGGVTINSRVQAPAQGALVINSSTSSTPTNIPHPQAAIQISGDTGEFASIYLTSYGDNSDAGSYRSIINLRGTRGTAAAPTANQAGDEIGRISARPYTGSTFAGSNASISFFAGENTSSTNQGGYMAFRTTPLGTVAGGSYTNPPERVRVQPSGGMSIGNPTWNATDPGHGSLSVYSKLGIGSTTPYSSLSVVGTSTIPLIAAYSSANSPYFLVDTNGRVTIGTSTSASTDKLSINGGNLFIRNLTPQFVLVDTAVTDQNFGMRMQSGVASFFRANNDSSLSAFLLGMDVNNAYTGFATSAPKARISLVRGTTAVEGINFGDDVNLYRNAADSLKTDDNFYVSTGIVLEAGSSGRVYANGGLVNLSSANNSRIRTTDGGTIVDRNIANSAAALTVTQLNAASTGNILELRNNSATTTVFTQAGRVGVGTTTPATTVDVNGLIRVYQTSTTTCSASIEGSIFYNGTTGNKHFWGCDGTNWNRLD